MLSQKYWVYPIRIFRHQSICLLFLQLVVAAVALNPLCIVSEACINYIFCGTLEISNEARNWFAGNNEDVWATHLLEQWIGKFSVMVMGGGKLSQLPDTRWAAMCFRIFPPRISTNFPVANGLGHCLRIADERVDIRISILRSGLFSISVVS